MDPAKPKPVLPIAEPPVNRARLLLAVVRAASSHTSGFDDSEAQRLLDGKQFKFRMRFGCEPTSSPGLPLTWSQDSDGRTLRFAASSNLSLDDKEMRLLAPPGIKAAEGFWLDRPWMLAAACPAQESDVEPSTKVEGDIGKGEGGRASDPAEATQKIGIAQFLASENDTAPRRLAGPYEAVVKLEEGRVPSKEGYDFVMAGRLRALGNGRVIMCAGNGPDQPPDCVVSVNIDRAWIETPGDGHVLAQWGN